MTTHANGGVIQPSKGGTTVILGKDKPETVIPMTPELIAIRRASRDEKRRQAERIARWETRRRWLRKHHLPVPKFMLP